MTIDQFTFISGGARGADTRWQNELQKLGAKFIVYTPNSLDNLTTEEYFEIEQQYQSVVSELGRNYMPDSIYPGLLVRRDMLQANNASQIIAIASIGDNGYVNGGTGYSTTRGIQRGVPVYVFDQEECLWYFWDYNSNQFTEYIFRSENDYPKLVDKTCLVGTRRLNDSGRIAMNNIILNFVEENGN